jgi:glycosyltransferase involved in cell wall biosynthesis
LRLGVAFTGDPEKPTTWSGTPRGLVGGLAQLGVEPVGVNVEAGPALDFVARNFVTSLRLHRAWRGDVDRTIRLARAMARASPELAVLRTWVGNRALKRAGRLDGIVQIGTGYSFDTRRPIVVFCDLTVVQALKLGYPGWDRLSQRAVRARIDRQRRNYEHAVACCATTGWACESIVRDYGIPREKVFAVGVGRNHDPGPVDRDWTTPRFLWIGTDWHGKNGENVLRSFEQLRREQPGARLDLVGTHPSVHIEGVTGHGTLRLDDPRHRAQMAELLHAATCFVLPSRYEAAAIAYVDAGGTGLPCIGTTVGGARELIGEAGRLVDPADPEALFRAMLELSDPGTAERLGAIALQRAPLFTWKAVAERVLRALGLPHPRRDSFADFL